MKFSCYLLSNGNDTDPHSQLYGDKRVCGHKQKDEETDKETGMQQPQAENHSMEFLESFKQKIESDIDTLRNLTYRAISQSQSSKCKFSYVVRKFDKLIMTFKD